MNTARLHSPLIMVKKKKKKANFHKIQKKVQIHVCIDVDLVVIYKKHTVIFVICVLCPL